jgi:catechol 2,3-dioxygenase-like lactoylglutathione lyase family enzyme
LLGQFLEFSLPTPDIQASLEFYLKLGFTEATVGETWTHPYAVVTDGRICLGLHQNAEMAATLTYVKPGLLQHIGVLESLGVEFEYRRLGNDVFNEIGWADPSGQMVRLIEARTFSPAKRPSSQWSRCGYFLEVALPSPELDAGKAYWEKFGFVGMDEQEDVLPHISCTSDFIDLGLYGRQSLQGFALRFETEDLAGALTQIAQAGIEPARRSPLKLPKSRGEVLLAPEGTPLLLLSPP